MSTYTLSSIMQTDFVDQGNKYTVWPELVLQHSL